MSDNAQIVADRFASAGVNEDRFVSVVDGEKASHDHDTRFDSPVDVPGQNYGIYADPDDAVVLIDVDDYDDETDDAGLAAINKLQDTFTQESAHGGEHRIYVVTTNDDAPVATVLEDEFGAKNPNPSWGEVRAANQYIVGAGSQLDGCDKDWCDACADAEGGYYTVDVDALIAEINATALVSALRQDPELSAGDDDADHTDSQADEQPASEAGVEDRLETALNESDDETLKALWRGDYSSYGGDRSEAECALAAKLGFWLGGLASGAALEREVARVFDGYVSVDGWGTPDVDKWDERDDDSYRDSVLEAVHRPSEHYEPGSAVSAKTAKELIAEYSDEYDSPDDVPNIFDPDTPVDAADSETGESDRGDVETSLDTVLSLYETEPDRDMEHWEEIWGAVGQLPPETAEEFADRVAEVCDVPEERVTKHAEYAEHETDQGRIVVEDGKTWYLDGHPRRRYELLNFELDVQSTLEVSRGPIRAEIRADLRDGSSFTKSIEPKVFNDKQRFDDEILAESFGTKFNIPNAPSDPYTQDLLDALRTWIHRQDVPHRIGTKHMGYHDGEIALPGRTLTADGWTEEPDHVYLEREIGAERRVSMPDHDDPDRGAVARILETFPKTRDPERLLPVLGWSFAAPLRPALEDFAQSGEFNHLSVVGDTGSGKTATLSYLWRMFGMSGEPFSVDSSNFAQLTTFSSTNSIPLWFDEYKPSDIRDYKIDRFHDRYRKATRGAIAERGNSDQTTTTYKIEAPVVVSGEQQIQGPAERRRTVQTQFRSATTDPGTDTARRFKNLVGKARIEDDQIEIADDAPDPGEHALAYYRWICDVDDAHLRELWYDSLEAAHRRLDELGVAEALDELEIQGIQTVIFGFELMREFAGWVGADTDELPDRDTLDDAIGHVVDRIGVEGTRKSHPDRFIELFGRAAAADEYIERGTHYELVKEGTSNEELRVNLPRTFDAVSKYARDHDISGTDLLNDPTDYRDRFREMADDPSTYATAVRQYTPGVSDCTGIDVAAVVDALEFDRGVLETDERHPDIDHTTAGGDDDGSDDDDGGDDDSDPFSAPVKPIEEIDPDRQLAASVEASLEVGKYNGWNFESNKPDLTVTLDDGTATAQLVIWDRQDVPTELINDDAIIVADRVRIENAKVGEYDDEIQLTVTKKTTVTVTDRPEEPLSAAAETDDTAAETDDSAAATDGGEPTGDSLRALEDAAKQAIINRPNTDSLPRGELAQAVLANTEAADPDRVSKAIDKALERGALVKTPDDMIGT